jgi:hypothetical protein
LEEIEKYLKNPLLYPPHKGEDESEAIRWGEESSLLKTLINIKDSKYS